MVVDRVVPEEGLVAVAPGEVLGADVLVGVLDALLERRHVLPVLPVLRPQVPGVQAREDEGRRDAAGEGFWLALIRPSAYKSYLITS